MSRSRMPSIRDLKLSSTNVSTTASEATTIRFSAASRNLLLMSRHQAQHHHHPPHKLHKIHIPLPGLDSYEKELEFHADAPGRVVIRLEKLMGHDRIRITDPKYMKLLLFKLEQEEMKELKRRSEMRRKKEEDRSRLMAIEGLMEPTMDMKHLFDHPVFRVNRILNRLAKLQNQHFDINTNEKIPPITPVEPFETYAETGVLFGFHSNHYLKSRSESKSTAPPATDPDPKFQVVKPASPVTATTDLDTEMETTTDFETEMEWGGEDYLNFTNLGDEPGSSGEKKRSINTILRDGNLEEAKAHYGINVQEDLDEIWRRHQSPLINLIYQKEQEDTNALFDVSREVIGAYKRKVIVTDQFCNKTHRRLFM